MPLSTNACVGSAVDASHMGEQTLTSPASAARPGLPAGKADGDPITRHGGDRSCFRFDPDGGPRLRCLPRFAGTNPAGAMVVRPQLVRSPSVRQHGLNAALAIE